MGEPWVPEELATALRYARMAEDVGVLEAQFHVSPPGQAHTLWRIEEVGHGLTCRSEERKCVALKEFGLHDWVSVYEEKGKEVIQELLRAAAVLILITVRITG